MSDKSMELAAQLTEITNKLPPEAQEKLLIFAMGVQAASQLNQKD